MTTYEALSLMITFAVFVIALLAYIKQDDSRRK